MPHHEIVALSGVIVNVFAHRFTLEAKGKIHLADLGPKGAEAFSLAEGLEVALKGEQRPSEIKVTEIAGKGKKVVAILHKKPHHGPRDRPGPDHGPHHPPHHLSVDPALALRAAEAAGWVASGEPHRKPQHFEVLARRSDSSGPWAELHIDLDGGLYKVKAVPADGGKWKNFIS